MAGAVPDGTLPLHKVVIKRCTVIVAAALDAVDGEDHPGAADLRIEAARRRLLRRGHDLLVDLAFVDGVHGEPDIGPSLGAPADRVLSSTVPRNTAVDWRNARSVEIPAQSHAYALPGGATMAAKTPSNGRHEGEQLPGEPPHSGQSWRLSGRRQGRCSAQLMVAIGSGPACSTIGIRLEPEEVCVEPAWRISS